MKYLLSIILASLFLFSCESTPTTRVKGTVLEEGTLKPIANAKVIFYQYYSKGLFQGSVKWLIDTVYTDSEGKFEWETEVNPNEYFNDYRGEFGIYKIEHTDYFKLVKDAITRQGNKTSFNYTDKETIEAHMTPHAYLDLTLINAAIPSTNYCRFGISKSNVFEDLYNEDLKDTFLIPGYRMLIYKFTTDINLDTFEIDSFYIGAYETKELSYIY